MSARTDNRTGSRPGESQAPTGYREHHRNVQGGSVRAAVFGVSDGLVANVSLILGMAGAAVGQDVVRVAGLAGLFAGAFSMAAGEFVSMSAQAELLGRELNVERKSLDDDPSGERRELVSIYTERGVERSLAERLAAVLMRDPELALKTHLREEMGITAKALGSPPLAALSSFVAFAAGALVPLLPWFFVGGISGVLASLTLATGAASLVGAAIGISSGRSSWIAALRQVAVGAAAAGLTYGIGSLLGVHIS